MTLIGITKTVLVIILAIIGILGMLGIAIVLGALIVTLAISEFVELRENIKEIKKQKEGNIK